MSYLSPQLGLVNRFSGLRIWMMNKILTAEACFQKVKLQLISIECLSWGWSRKKNTMRQHAHNRWMTNGRILKATPMLSVHYSYTGRKLCRSDTWSETQNLELTLTAETNCWQVKGLMPSILQFRPRHLTSGSDFFYGDKIVGQLTLVWESEGLSQNLFSLWHLHSSSSKN